MNWKELAEKARAIAQEALIAGDAAGYLAALTQATYYDCLAVNQ